MTIREAIESPVVQGSGETIAYTITTTPWGSTPTDVSMALYDVSDPYSEVDVSSTKLSGSTSVASDVITCKAVTGLVDGHTYRAEVQFTDADSNVWEAYFIVKCKDG